MPCENHLQLPPSIFGKEWCASPSHTPPPHPPGLLCLQPPGCLRPGGHCPGQTTAGTVIATTGLTSRPQAEPSNGLHPDLGSLERSLSLGSPDPLPFPSLWLPSPSTKAGGAAGLHRGAPWGTGSCGQGPLLGARLVLKFRMP